MLQPFLFSFRVDKVIPYQLPVNKVQGNSQTCFYNLGKEAKEDWKYTESFKQLILLGGYFGTFYPPEIHVSENTQKWNTRSFLGNRVTSCSLLSLPACCQAVRPPSSARTEVLGRTADSLPQAVDLRSYTSHTRRMELAVEKEHLRKGRLWSSCCNDVWGGSPEREQWVSRNAGLLGSTVLFRGEARRASWQYAFLIPCVRRCWKWLYFGDGSRHAFTDLDLGLQLPTQHYCSNFPFRSLTVAAQMLGADPNLYGITKHSAVLF